MKKGKHSFTEITNKLICTCIYIGAYISYICAYVYAYTKCLVVMVCLVTAPKLFCHNIPIRFFFKNWLHWRSLRNYFICNIFPYQQNIVTVVCILDFCTQLDSLWEGASLKPFIALAKIFFLKLYPWPEFLLQKTDIHKKTWFPILPKYKDLPFFSEMNAVMTSFVFFFLDI